MSLFRKREPPASGPGAEQALPRAAACFTTPAMTRRAADWLGNLGGCRPLGILSDDYDDVVWQCTAERADLLLLELDFSNGVEDKDVSSRCDIAVEVRRKLPECRVYLVCEDGHPEKLAALDGEYQTVVDNAARKTVLFGDRFPFRYLVDDYGLSYYAAFAGCSAETEASFETVSFLAKKVDELKLPCVLTIEGKNHKIAETIVQNTAGKNQKILTMDSMQSTTSKDVANGATYLSVMEKNLSVLKEALG